LKAVYYPSGDFLDANKVNSPSRIWRSIVDGWDVLKQGLIRRIGTGETTNIWSIDWLPTARLRRPIRCNTANPPQLVSELIDGSSVCWDMSKLQTFFTLADIEVISNIPLCHGRQEDFWAWHHEKNGFLFVRSAYRILASMKASSIAGRSNRKEEEKEWINQWGVKVPSKVRLFLRRLARSSLPSKVVLHYRKMAYSNSCSILWAMTRRSILL
jgi:hypothetical protein